MIEPTFEQYQRWGSLMSYSMGIVQGLLRVEQKTPWQLHESDLKAAIEEMRPFAVSARLAEAEQGANKDQPFCPTTVK